MNLIIVESPTKAKTISHFLGKDFDIESSFGHLRDLPKSKLGVDIEHNFAPTYEVPKKAAAHVKTLIEKAQKADVIYYATDGDREGEAISWHIDELFNEKKNMPKKRLRIIFHEITKSALMEALEHPSKINNNLVNAQQTRRILDRLVGYKLSPFLWKKVMRGLSAGRVQSVTVRLVVDREREIRAFKKQEYWTIDALFNKKTGEKEPFSASLHSYNTKKLDKFAISRELEAEDMRKTLEKLHYAVSSIAVKEARKKPFPPFRTATLQQDAHSKFGFSIKQTMMLAQKLYEGVHLGHTKGSTGLITYMRTDSTALANKFIVQAKNYLETTLGAKYSFEKPRIFKNKAKGAQEAHEAIRPTDITHTPEFVKPFLEPREHKLYSIIWQRALASLMGDAIINNTIVEIEGKQGDTTAIFRAVGARVMFDGFLKIYPMKVNENELPKLEANEPLSLEKMSADQHFTEPPPRYNDASLVKELEKRGIGRPSTYAPTLETIITRRYVERDDQKRFFPTEIGELVNDLLEKHFPNIVDYNFTAEMENSLDDIAEKGTSWTQVLENFYTPFAATLKKKSDEVDKKSITQEETTIPCPLCGKFLVSKIGRFGKFFACSGYPECKHTQPLESDVAENAALMPDAPECDKCKVKMIIKEGRYGKFFACPNYPSCKNTHKIEQKINMICDECKKGDIVVKKTKKGRIFYGCNRYPDCSYASWKKPLS